VFAPSAMSTCHHRRSRVPGHLPAQNGRSDNLSPWRGLRPTNEEPHQEQRDDHQDEYLEEVAEFTDDAEDATAPVRQDQDDIAEAHGLRSGDNRSRQFDNPGGQDGRGQQEPGGTLSTASNSPSRFVSPPISIMDPPPALVTRADHTTGLGR